jgi:hypothetical protein
MSRSAMRAANAIILVACALAVRAADSEEAAAIIQRSREASAKLTDFVCSQTIETISQSDISLQTGKIKWLAPSYIMTLSKTEGEGGASTMFLSDGKDVFTETRGPDGQIAVFHYTVKPAEKPEGASNPVMEGESHTPQQLFDRLGAMYDWEVDADKTGSTIQDMAMDVLIGKYREGAAEEFIKPPEGETPDLKTQRTLALRRNLVKSMVGSMRVWIGRADKFIHRIELIPAETPSAVVSEDGAETSPLPLEQPRIVMTYLDVKLNSKQTPADFVYTVPAGAQVNELPPR